MSFMKMDTCYCPFLFIVDVVIINNILLARNKCQHIIIIKDFFFVISMSHRIFQPNIKMIFFVQAHSICA